MRLNPFAERATLQVQTDRPRYRPGEAIRVRVRVAADGELTVEEVRVDLIATNRYTFDSRQRRDGADRVVRVTRSDDAVVATVRFQDAGTVPSGQATEYEMELPLPTDAPPTGAGEITSVAWKVRAMLRVPRANDPDGEAPLAVLAPAAAAADATSRPAEASDPLAVDLAFDLPGRSVRADQAVEGTLRIAPRQEIEVREVRVELVRDERVDHDLGLTEETVVASKRLDGETRLPAGEQRGYPFVVTIPADACPSLQTPRTRVRWLLRAVLDRPLRDDHTAAIELTVFNAD